MSNKFFTETHSRFVVTDGDIGKSSSCYNIFTVTPSKKVA